MEYAGFWRRFVAYLIDYLVFLVGALVAGFVIGLIAGATGAEEIDGPWLASVYAAAIAGYYLYYALMESSSHQATVGKIALGIKVTDLDGNPILFWQALGRSLAKIISAITLFIGYIMAAFTKRKQALHDKIAKTLVVKRASAPADPAA
jgi:uncharacterized RDD family membrane protein YckC